MAIMRIRLEPALLRVALEPFIEGLGAYTEHLRSAGLIAAGKLDRAESGWLRETRAGINDVAGAVRVSPCAIRLLCPSLQSEQS